MSSMLLTFPLGFHGVEVLLLSLAVPIHEDSHRTNHDQEAYDGTRHDGGHSCVLVLIVLDWEDIEINRLKVV